MKVVRRTKVQDDGVQLSGKVRVRMYEVDVNGKAAVGFCRSITLVETNVDEVFSIVTKSLEERSNESKESV